MTQGEAIKSLQSIIEHWTYKPTEAEAIKMAIAALHPASQEQVGRVWPGCEVCKNAGLVIGEVQFYGSLERSIDVSGNMHYCPNCSYPITPVARDRRRKKLETLKNGKSDL